ncbi:ATPase family associated with various cellular activities (AAA) [Chitinophaga sp. YR627]|uniref:ATP-binding protein n=1 Tax=Chitinophaga sp. YR627 TaxID=1881041 RepID=UPI0008E54C4C|nr:ATP-binding protein [Chitinophaga sp. YR627]SFM97543.1 ATPase family associated with various cellular activities (AAA) [Chitinophaga sp. YR627]
MDTHLIANNAAALHDELLWFAQILQLRMKQYFEEAHTQVEEEPAPPALNNDAVYSQIVRHYNMQVPERLVLLLALCPHLQPQLLDIFFVKNSTYDRGFTEFGGIKGNQHGGFLPTGETAAFLLAANDLQQRLQLQKMFTPDHFFVRDNILKLASVHADEPLLSGGLQLTSEYLSYFTTGKAYQPQYSTQFPAKQIRTALNWSDLVLDPHTMQEVEEIRTWIEHGPALLRDWKMENRIKPGYRALFYGPPGTGKSFTACLLGKTFNMDVYRIDLSMIVSKYIGETEKNLAGVFDQAANKNWILFFDEADALFGKRSATNSSNDRYANQEVAYLLQRIEDFPGLVILATNLKANIDEAFGRRFQSMIYFPVPAPAQRQRLWQQSFPQEAALDQDVSLEEIARKHELAGGAIINVVQYSCLSALKRNSRTILLKDIQTGIRKEFNKEGKTLNL